MRKMRGKNTKVADTVEWAVRAAQERKLRISSLTVSGTNLGEICIGSRPRKPTDRVPDASWKLTKPDPHLVWDFFKGSAHHWGQMQCCITSVRDSSDWGFPASLGANAMLPYFREGFL